MTYRIYVFAALGLWAAQAAHAAQGDCVVLLHGLARSETSLLAMETALVADGYYVINESYPSTHATIEVLAQGVGDRVVNVAARG